MFDELSFGVWSQVTTLENSSSSVALRICFNNSFYSVLMAVVVVKGCVDSIFTLFIAISSQAEATLPKPPNGDLRTDAGPTILITGDQV